MGLQNNAPLKIYLGGPMFTYADIANNLRLAKKLRAFGFEVYCPNENLSINDKTRTDITSEKIYLEDIERLKSSNVFLCQVAEDSGTMWEAGFMDCLSQMRWDDAYLGCIGLATDIRLLTPPTPEKSGVDNQSMYLNQFVIGGLKLSLGVYQDEDSMIERLLALKCTQPNEGM